MKCNRAEDGAGDWHLRSVWGQKLWLFGNARRTNCQPGSQWYHHNDIKLPVRQAWTYLPMGHSAFNRLNKWWRKSEQEGKDLSKSLKILCTVPKSLPTQSPWCLKSLLYTFVRQRISPGIFLKRYRLREGTPRSQCELIRCLSSPAADIEANGGSEW